VPVLRSENAPEFDVDGIRVRGLASPSRGAHETMMYRVVMSPGDELPRHHHDHEEVFHVLSGSLLAVLDGEEHSVAEGDTVMIPPGVPHHSVAGEDGAIFLAATPTGTSMIRPDGQRVQPPWAE
jgi:quercetin dioxygenase-like cupin family protein